MAYQSRAIHSQNKKIREICNIRGFDFSNSEITCALTNVATSYFGRKTAARRFYLIHNILRSLTRTQSLLRGRNASIWRSGNRGSKIVLSGMSFGFMGSKFRPLTDPIQSKSPGLK